MRIRIALVLIVLLAIGCGGGPAPTTAPTPKASGILDLLLDYAANGPVSMTCGAWNHATAPAQTATALQMLTAIRGFDVEASDTPPSSSQVETLRMAITGDCTAGSDCTDPDLYCDIDRVAEVATTEYILHVQELRP